MILMAVGSFYAENNKTFAAVNDNVTCVCCKNLLGSFSNDDGDGREKVTVKMNSRFFFKRPPNVVVIFPTRLKCQM